MTALQWLQAPEGAPWSWSDDEAGDWVLTWRDGSTIAFRAELIALLETLGERRWPPFEALVLTLAACRGRVCDAASHLTARAGPVSKAGQLILDLDVAYEAGEEDEASPVVPLANGAIAQATAVLEKVALLPAELRTGLGPKAILAEQLAEGRPVPTAEDLRRQQEVLALLRSAGATVVELNSGLRSSPLPALGAVLTGLRDLDPVSLRRRRGTGLGRGVKPALPDAPNPAALLRRLIADWQSDPRRAGLARVARHALAALRVPRLLAERDPLAVGGMSDLSNRGSLDRLLLSELANDDLTLAVRVALNEALYLRREPPATPAPGGFVVLLDAGIRAWGAPRVFAVALAMALGASDERRASFFAWRGRGNALEPVDFADEESLDAHLAALETDAHPGTALPAFFRRVIPAAGARAPRPEPVIVAPAATLRDEGFRRALADWPTAHGPLWLLGVDGAGNFALTLHPAEGRPPACAARLELEPLLGDAPSPIAATAVASEDLPAALRLPRLPLLLPVMGNMLDGLILPDGRCCALTETRCLVTWNSNPASQGAVFHAHGLPAGRLLALHADAAGVVHVLSAAWYDGRIPHHRVDLRTDEHVLGSLVLRCPPESMEIMPGGTVAFLRFPGRVDVWELATGQPLGQVHAGPSAWVVGERYLHVNQPPPGGQKAVRIVAWDGARVTTADLPSEEPWAAVFTLPGHEGPWGCTSDGRVGPVAGGRLVAVPALVAAMGKARQWRIKASRDGQRLIYCGGNGPNQPGASLAPTHPLWPGKQTPGPVPLHRAFMPPRCSMRTKFEGIGVDGAGRIALRKNPHSHAAFSADEKGLVLGRTNSFPLTAWQPFGRARRPAGTDARLREAVWPNGARAWLDARGLLHLRFADARASEMTITLNDGPTAGWTADGLSAGSTFFLADPPSSTPGHLAERLRRFADHLRAV